MAKEEDEGNILPVNKAKTYGIQIPSNRAYVTVYKRTKFTEDTSIPYPDKKGGMAYKLYKAGQFSSWEMVFGPYENSLANAISKISKLMLLDQLEQESLKLDKLVGQIKEIDQELKNEISKIDWKQRQLSTENQE